jgi:hypothetical protein
MPKGIGYGTDKRHKKRSKKKDKEIKRKGQAIPTWIQTKDWLKKNKNKGLNF